MKYIRRSKFMGSFLATLAGVFLLGVTTANAQKMSCPSASFVQKTYIGDKEKLDIAKSCWAQKAGRGDKDLREAYLEGVDLKTADLSLADLRNANLSNTDLAGVSLNAAVLIGANLNGANLTEAKLGSYNRNGRVEVTDLSNANMRNAKLDYADLRMANLSGADLTGATIRKTEFRMAKVSTSTKAPNRDTDWARLEANFVD